MHYKATTQKRLFMYLLLLDLYLFVISFGNVILMTLAGLLALFCMLLSFVKYEFEIEEKTLRYRIKCLHFLLYEKLVNAQEVQAIQFKRAGWTTRLAIVKLHKGWNIRVMLFTPLEIFHQLKMFAKRNNIEISRTEDYKILEKMAR